MATSWKEVTQKPEYQSLSPEDQERARNQYFQTVVMPQVSNQNDLPEVRRQFDASTSPMATPFGQSVQRETAQMASEDAQAPSLASQFGRAALRTGKALSEGAAETVDLLAAPIRAGINAIAPQGYQAGTLADVSNQAYDKLANYTAQNLSAQNAPERYADTISRGLGSTIGGIGVGGALARSTVPTVSALGNILASSPGMQAASATTGSASSQLANESGASPLVQNIAGVVGGLVPSIPAAGQAGVQALLRGGEAGRQRVAQNIADFANAGSTPTVGQATQTPIARGFESLLAKTPGASGVMEGAAQRQADQVSQGLSNLSENLSPGADSGTAGRAIIRGIGGDNGFISRFKNQSGQLYDRLDQFIPSDTRVSIENTQRILPELNALIQGAPNTSKLFQNAKILGIEGGLRSDIGGIESAMTRPDVQSAMRQRAAQVDAQNQQIVASNRAGQDAVDRYNASQASLSGSMGQSQPQVFTPQPLIDRNQAMNDVASSMVDNRLPYEAVKKLRTLVGDQLSDFSLTSDVPRSKWKALYASLSSDLKDAASQQGDDAVQAWQRANNYYNAGSNRIDVLSRVVDKNGGPEAVFNAAMSGTKDGASTLRSVMQSLDPDQQKTLSAAVINRLGKATPGQQNAAGDQFSMGTFLTNWNNLSDKARSTLFDRYGPQFSKDMDSIANVASNVREGSKYLANPSGSATTGAHIGTTGALIMSLLTGNFGTAGAIGGGMALGNLSGRLMTNPTFVRFLAKQTQIPSQGFVPALVSLRGTAEQKKDPDLKEAADLMANSINQTQNP